MISRRWMIVSALAATPVLGLVGYEAAQAQYTPQPAPQYPPQQYPPQYQQQQYPPQQQQQQQQPALDPQAQRELGIELKKAQIQAALGERIAQVKEDYLRKLKERGAQGPVDDGQVAEAEADAAGARAGAEVAKLNTQILDLQLRSGQVPPQQLGYGQANPTTIQILQLELKKAQMQTRLTQQIAAIRQRTFERLRQSQNVPVDAMTGATLDYESSRAMAEVAQLDEQVAASRLQTAGGRP